MIDWAPGAQLPRDRFDSTCHKIVNGAQRSRSLDSGCRYQAKHARSKLSECSPTGGYRARVQPEPLTQLRSVAFPTCTNYWRR